MISWDDLSDDFELPTKSAPKVVAPKPTEATESKEPVPWSCSMDEGCEACQ